MSDREADLSAMHPAELAGHMFGTGFRGYDQEEVRTFLRDVAEAMARVQAERDDLSQRLSASEKRVVQVSDLDEDQLTAALGEETARVLASARHAATEIRTKAEENAARLLDEAGADATAQRTAADEASTAARTAAETAAAGAMVEADAYATRIRSEADGDAAELRSNTASEAAATRAGADEYATRIRAETDSVAATTRTDADAYSAKTRSEAEAAVASIRSDADTYAEAVRSTAVEAASAVTTEADAQAAMTRTEAEDAASAELAAANVAAASLVAGATADADALCAEAAGLLAQRTAEAEAASATMQEASAHAEQVAAEEVAALLAAGEQEGRELVAEAQQVRERILKDLARRRKASRVQVEQLRAARERLLEAYEVVRRTTEEATTELVVALPEARVAAQDAARRIESEADASVLDLEAEIEQARTAGLLGPPSTVDEEAEAAAEAQDDDQPSPAEVADVGTREVEAEARRSEDEPEIGTSKGSVADAEVVEAADVELPADGPDLTDVEREPQNPTPRVVDPGEVADSREVVDDLFARLRASRPDTDDPVAGPDPGSVEERPAVESEPAEVVVAEGLVSMLERRDGLLDDAERSLGRRLKRVLADEQNRVLDAVRRARTLPSVDEVLPSVADHVASYADVSIDDLTASARAGAQFQGAEPGHEPGAVDDLAMALAEELTSWLRPRIERSFADVGGDEEELTTLVRSCYREAKSPRIAELARHHVLTAFSRGQFEVVPEGSQLRWVIDDSGDPCPDAEDNALAGLVVKGESFPTGHCTSPAHPGCRCMVVTVPAESK